MYDAFLQKKYPKHNELFYARVEINTQLDECTFDATPAGHNLQNRGIT